MSLTIILFFFFFFNDTATTEIYTLSLHDALPIFFGPVITPGACFWSGDYTGGLLTSPPVYSRGANCSLGSRGMMSTRDRKSTRLNSSHQIISYAVFCLKKKK